MKTAPSILLTLAIGMASFRLGLAQPTPPSPPAAPAPAVAPSPQPTPPTPWETNVDEFGRQIELSTNRAVHEAAAAEKAAKAAVKAAKGHFPININLNLGKSHEPSAKIREAAASISEAPDEAAREAATAKLLTLIDEYFEADMRAREQDLAEIEARVERLRAQLDHRRAKKQEIIDLQAKVATNEAAGLGFYGERNSGGFDFATPTGKPEPMFVPDGPKSTSEPSSPHEVPSALLPQ